MMDDPNIPLVLFWWNTSLSPLGERQAARAEIDFVISQIRRFRTDYRAAVIALAEVSPADLAEIMAALNDPYLALHDATGVIQRTKFDIALIYDKQRLEMIRNLSIVDAYAGRALKIGEHVHFISTDTGLPIDIIFSHWPSRIHLHERDPKRTYFGIRLAEKFKEIRVASKLAKIDPYLVLLGDYNDDPFSPSLADHLIATRDRDVAQASEEIFYNPTWRWMGEMDLVGVDSGIHRICGTYYWSHGVTTRWHTFDQIIFSPAFLRGGRIELEENLGSVFVTKDLRDRILSSRTKLDHLPVVSVLNMKRVK